MAGHPLISRGREGILEIGAGVGGISQATFRGWKDNASFNAPVVKAALEHLDAPGWQ